MLAGQSFLPAEESFLSLYSFDADVGAAAAAAHDVADMGHQHSCTNNRFVLLSEVRRIQRPRRESPGRLWEARAELGIDCFSRFI